ncbi:MAG: ABC transporter substrate-binding protein [Spirochaetota bacterium]
MKKTLFVMLALLMLLPALTFARGAREEIVEDPESGSTGETLPGVIDIDYSEWERGRYGGRIVLSYLQEPQTFNPWLPGDDNSRTVWTQFYGSSISRNQLTLEPEAQMAESWTVSDDETSVTVRIKEGLVYSDGTPITAHDFVFGMNHIYLRAATGSQNREYFYVAPAPDEPPEPPEVELIDDYTYRYSLPATYANLVLEAGLSPMPRHIIGPAIGWTEEVGYDYEWEWGEDDNGNPIVVDIDDPRVDYAAAQNLFGVDMNPSDYVSSGPFTFKEYLPGERIVLERNPNYWREDEWGQQLPYLDEVAYVIVPETDTTLQRFRAGEIDIYAMRGQDYAELVEERDEGNFVIYNRGPSSSTNFVFFNQNPIEGEDDGGIPEPQVTWFNNTTFRQAVAQLVDQETIINNVHNGIALPGRTFISPGPFYPEDMAERAWKYNPAEAERLLDSIDYIDRDDDGWREDPDGNKLEWTLITNAGAREREAMCEIIAQDLRAVGLDVTFQPTAWGEMITSLTETYDFEMMMIGLGGGDVDPLASGSVVPSNAALHMWEPNQSSPRREWEAEIDRLWNIGETTTDLETRQDAYRQIAYIWVEQAPMVYTHRPLSLNAVSQEFGNYKAQQGSYDTRAVLDRMFVR